MNSDNLKCHSVLLRFFGGALKNWLSPLPLLAWALISGQAFAVNENLAVLLSPSVVRMSLAKLQKSLGPMECTSGAAEDKDCFIALPVGAANLPGSDYKGWAFLRVRGGHVGQVIINGPAWQLTKVLEVLALHYVVSNTGITPPPLTLGPCKKLSERQSEGVSVLVKVCRSPIGGSSDFVVNILADWYAFSG